MNYQFITALIAIFTMMGCTSMQPMQTDHAKIQNKIEIGDHLIIYENSGRIVDMTLTMIDGDILRGSLADNNLTPVEVSVHDIAKIEIEKVDGGKTVLAVVGGVAAAVVLIPLVLLASLASGG